MPFQEGNTLAIGNSGGGRKGYEFEKEQLIKMREILNKDLALVENIQSGEIDEAKIRKLTILTSRILKIFDKLHASKEHTEIAGDPELPVRIVQYVKPTEPI